LDHVNYQDGWSESDAMYYLDMELGRDVSAFDGVSLGINPSGFSRLTVTLKKETKDGTQLWCAPMLLVPGKWQEVKLPFRVFMPDAPGSIPGGKLTLELIFGLKDNVQQGYFSDSTQVKASVSVDDIGLCNISGSEASGLVEAFEDDINRYPAYAELYGARYFEDYRLTDEGVLTENTAVSALSVSITRESGGPKGSYMVIRAVVDLEQDGRKSFAEVDEYLMVRGRVNVPWEKFSAFSFLARSNVLESGTVEFYDVQNDAYYSADINLTASWGRQLLPYDQLHAETGSLATAKKKPGQVELGFSFNVPKRALAKAVDSGKLEVELFIDELYLLEE
jgi:hypothetical protein